MFVCILVAYTHRLWPNSVPVIRRVTFADRGVVYKVAVWRSGNGRIHFVTVAVLRPFRNTVRPIWQMILHTMPDTEVCVSVNSMCDLRLRLTPNHTEGSLSTWNA